MKIVAVNGGPRRGKNTDQMLDAFLEGIRETNPEAEVEIIRLYDYTFKGCISCFSCQMKNHRDDLQCWLKDDMTQFLKDTRQADGIVFASPLYYQNVTAQLRLFMERLQYPGSSDRTVPTTLIYTMNAQEDICKKLMGRPLEIISWYLEGCFHDKPEVVNAYNTYQYNDDERLNDHFRSMAEAKWAHHEEQFATDLQNAKDAGKRMVARIKEKNV